MPELSKSQDADRLYVLEVLLPELRNRFKSWNDEYTQERDLGVRGEWAGLYRKTRKLKTAIWDNDHRASDAPHRKWRESLRTIALEIAAHALLLVTDLDLADTKTAPCGQPFPCAHAPDGGNHPAPGVPSA